MVIIVNLDLDVVGEGVGLGSPFAKLSTFQNSKLSGLEETHTTKSVVNPKSTFTQLSNQFKVLTNRKSSRCVPTDSTVSDKPTNRKRAGGIKRKEE